MKKIIYFFLLFGISSCSPKYVQLFETVTTNTNIVDNYYTYEDDTIKIKYSFWEDKGIMSFEITNKMSAPIYIDWKNSSLILNDVKLNYWEDEMNSNSISNYSTYYYKGPSSATKGVSYSKSTKPERVTFIPPNSKYKCYKYHLFPFSNYQMKDYASKVYKRAENPSQPEKTATVYYVNFNNNNSPLKFRNYIAVTFKEDSKIFKFIDNEFYVTSIKEMTLKHFKGEVINSSNKEYEFPFRNPQFFYLNIPKKASLNYILKSTMDNSQ